MNASGFDHPRPSLGGAFLRPETPGCVLVNYAGAMLAARLDRIEWTADVSDAMKLAPAVAGMVRIHVAGQYLDLQAVPCSANS